MTPFRRLVEICRDLHAILGAPGLMIGGFSIISFVFGLFVFIREYDRPRQTGRNAVHRIIGHWVRVPDDLGLTLVDFVDIWRNSSDAEKLSAARCSARSSAAWATSWKGRASDSR